jgi:hypothetical protein
MVVVDLVVIRGVQEEMCVYVLIRYEPLFLNLVLLGYLLWFFGVA